MEKKIFLFVIILFLSSCGYNAIYSKKNVENYNFSISKLNFIGDRQINLKIKEKLNNYMIDEKDKNFMLKISSVSKKIILAKTTSGDAANFQKKITLSIEVLVNNKYKNNFLIIENFNYKNVSNKFELKRYEKEIKDNLAEIATNKLIFKLSNIQ